MPRRLVGSVFRRPRPGKGPDGRTRYHPGYYVRLRRGGREIRRYAGPDRATALEVLARLLRQVDRETLLGEVLERDATFAAFVPRFLAHAQREQTANSFASLRPLVLNRLVPFFGRMRLRDIGPPEIERFLASRGRVKGATRNRELSHLSSIFRHAQDLRLVRGNPTKDVRRASEPQTPLPLVPLADQQRLLEVVDGFCRPLVLLGLETGMRLGEMLRLEWRDVDFSSNTLLVCETKGKRPRVLALSRRLRKALEEDAAARTRPLHGPDPVLAGAGAAHVGLSSRWRKAFKAAVRAIGHPQLRVHDLRHIAAINLVRAGLDLPTVGAFLGHRSLISTLRYAAYADGSAAARAARALDAIQATPSFPGGASEAATS